MSPVARKPLPTFDDLVRIREEVRAVDDRLVHSLPIVSIQPNPRNPRRRMDTIDELADSLRTHGLLQPIVVRRYGSGYELVAGHRRFEAAKRLGWTEIASVVRDETDDQAYILTLVENLQREDLQPKEEAAALEVLVWQLGSVRRVANAIKRSPMYVSSRLRVFADDVLAAPVLNQQLPVSTAEVLLRAPTEQRPTLVERAIAQGWGQKEAKRAVRECTVTVHPQGSSATLASGLSDRLDELSGELMAISPSELDLATRTAAVKLLEVLHHLVSAADVVPHFGP